MDFVKEIKSVNMIGGILYHNEIINPMVFNYVKNIDGFIKFKIYKFIDNSMSKYNIVIMIKKEYELLNKLDDSFNTITSNLHLTLENFHIYHQLYVIYK